LPGVLQKVAGDMQIELSDSWMIGDVLDDVEAGNRAGCKSILINNGNETEWKPGEDRIPDFFAKDLAEAAKYIVAAAKMTNSKKMISHEAKYNVH
jgi:D-glycero-D-manno-heptose 1,7-bisphosphate phosphatase